MDNQNKVGEKMKGLRLSKGLSVRGLASELNIDYSYLSRMENGKNKPSLDMLEQFAEYFNVHLSYFFVDSENEDKVGLTVNEKSALYETKLSLEEIKSKYDLTIDDEPATDEEIEEMIKYIKALRIMKKPN